MNEPRTWNKPHVVGRRTAVCVWLAASRGAHGSESAAAGSAKAHAPAVGGSGVSFAVSLPPERGTQALDGRLILLLSTDLTREPRSHVSPDEPLTSPYIFGLNVEALLNSTAPSGADLRSWRY